MVRNEDKKFYGTATVLEDVSEGEGDVIARKGVGDDVVGQSLAKLARNVELPEKMPLLLMSACIIIALFAGRALLSITFKVAGDMDKL